MTSRVHSAEIEQRHSHVTHRAQRLGVRLVGVNFQDAVRVDHELALAERRPTGRVGNIVLISVEEGAVEPEGNRPQPVRFWQVLRDLGFCWLSMDGLTFAALDACADFQD